VITICDSSQLNWSRCHKFCDSERHDYTAVITSPDAMWLFFKTQLNSTGSWVELSWVESGPAMWSGLNRQDLSSVDYRSHSGMYLSETARDVKHRRWAVVINRMIYYISQCRVETPIRRGGQLWHSFVANLLQYLCSKNYQNRILFDKVIAKIKVWFFATQCSFSCENMFAKLGRIAPIGRWIHMGCIA